MKTGTGILLTLMIAVFLAVPVEARQGTVREGLTVESAVLGEPVHYTVYLPPDYATSERFYPVVYLLHGYSDDESGWLQFGEMNRIVDAGIAEGSLPPMVIIMPDAGVSWYINDYLGKVRWEDMFITEFMPAVESMYRIRKKQEFRGIAGLSMGGFGSLVLSMHHPDLFGSVAAFSAGVITDEGIESMPEADWNFYYAHLFGGSALEGKDRLTRHWKENSVIELARTVPVDSLKNVRFFIDCGDDDFLTIGNATLHIEMTRRNIKHEFRMRDGRHTWEYWRTALPVGLAFIGERFHR